MGLYSKYVFPRLLDWGLGSEAHGQQRRVTLADARGSVLEVGFGTGLNLPHYPAAVTRLTVLDPERMLRDQVEARIRSAPMPVEQVQLDASQRLPFGDDSFDTVVTTWTLCSIRSLPPALLEIRRVLKPEGQFLFLEHGLSDDAKVMKWQNRLNPLHKIVACGCNINRPIDQLVRASGLEVVSLERFIMPQTPRISAEMYRGRAHKR